MRLNLKTVKSLIAILLLGGCSALALAEQGKTIVVQKGQTIRSIAAEYLGDAELWRTILEVNNLPSAASIRPGMKLGIPDQLVVETIRNIKELNDNIQEANKLQARVFANKEISNAIIFQKQVLLLKRSNRWNDALELVKKANENALEAIKICQENQNLEAQAVLNDMKGQVDKQDQKNRTWSVAELFATFREGDKVRTLNNSFAEILFKDESKLRLNSNSQIVIQQARSNLLKKTEKTTVSVVEGDVFALLNKNARNSFDVKVPGMEITTDSKNFYVKKDKDGKTKIANYDGDMKITHKKRSISLKKDQGLQISKKGFSKPKQLLPTPKPKLPADDVTIYRDSITLKWDKVKGAELYWLEIADDASFSKTKISANRLATNELKLKKLDEGIYYWRLSALDKDGFPSKRSKPFRFSYVKDDFPPYLAIIEPQLNVVVKDAKTPFVGETEPGSQLEIGGKKITVGPDGRFAVDVAMVEGKNEVKFVAFDPAGNKTELVHSVVYEPIKPIFVRFDSRIPRQGVRQFLSMTRNVAISGVTLPKSQIRINDGDMLVARSYSGGNGAFSVNFSLMENRKDFEIEIINNGRVFKEQFNVTLDNEAPLITLENYPAITRNDHIEVRGKITGAERSQFNGQALALSNGGFSKTLKLKAGENLFTIRASDAAGNVSYRTVGVIYDRVEPVLKDWQVTKQQVKDKRAVLLKVEVAEEHGLEQSLPFEIAAGDFYYSGVLRKASSNSYSGLIYLPEQNSREVQLISVTMQDKAGNKKQQNVNRRKLILQ